jgi:hypothetical protein
MRKWTVLLTVCLLLGSRPSARGQDEAKIQKLFQDAIQAMGGDTFLNVTDMVSNGTFYAFDREGNSSDLVKFDDYTKLPDKSRFEAGNKKKERDVTVFNLEKKEGWILEGQKDTREATPDEMEAFKNEVKHSLDTIFRTRYKDPENKLFYLGPSDADVQLETVRLLDPENDEVTIYFDRLSKLPAKLEYQVVDKRGLHYRETQEFSQWHVIQGVNTALRIDVARNGHKYIQQFVLKITYNYKLQDSFFSKPVPPK